MRNMFGRSESLLEAEHERSRIFSLRSRYRMLNGFKQPAKDMAIHDDWQSWKTLEQSTSFMFEHEIATDVKFTFPNNDQTVKAHRFMLMARSHVFFTMFSSGLDKPGEDIEIPDIEPAIFKQFLRSLYLDDTNLTTTTALQLTYCAEKYQVKVLKAQCMRFLRQQVNETTCAEILDHAVFYNDEPLTQACLHFLRSCKSLEILGLQEYHISRETLEVVMDYEELTVSEVDIFKFCQTWAEQECKKKEVPVNMTNKRKMLGTLVKKIPFCSMKLKEFVAEVSGRHFLNEQEELQIFRYLCAADIDTDKDKDKDKDRANPPFPCMKLRQAEGREVSVKLPEVWNNGKSDFYRFSIRCSESFTLTGLTFTHPGTFNIWCGPVHAVMTVPPGCLTVCLKEAVHCESGTKMSIKDFPSHLGSTINMEFPFSCEVRTHAFLHEKYDFVITKHNKYFTKPPFESLIVRI